MKIDDAGAKKLHFSSSRRNEPNRKTKFKKKSQSLFYSKVIVVNSADVICFLAKYNGFAAMFSEFMHKMQIFTMHLLPRTNFCSALFLLLSHFVSVVFLLLLFCSTSFDEWKFTRAYYKLQLHALGCYAMCSLRLKYIRHIFAAVGYEVNEKKKHNKKNFHLSSVVLQCVLFHTTGSASIYNQFDCISFNWMHRQ